MCVGIIIMPSSVYNSDGMKMNFHEFQKSTVNNAESIGALKQSVHNIDKTYITYNQRICKNKTVSRPFLFVYCVNRNFACRTEPT